MLTALRQQLAKPKVRFTLAGFCVTWGARTLVDLANETRRDLDELVELHAETRARVFGLETIEEGRRIVEAPPDDVVLNLEALRERLGIAGDDRPQPTDQSIDQSEEVQP